MTPKTLLLPVLLLFASFVAAAPAPIYVAPSVSHGGSADGEGSPFPDCPWDTRLLGYLVKSSANRVVVTPDPAAMPGQKLLLSARFGPLTGKGEKAAPSWIEVSGKLLDENGKTLGDFGFRDDRYAGSLHKCKEVVRLSEGLGDSVAGWLEEPVQGTKIADTISLLREDSVDADIRKSCPWDTELPNYLAGLTFGNVYRVAEDIGAASGRKLLLTITNSRMLGGGIYTGFKWMTVKGSLIDNEREIGSFVAVRKSFRAWTGCGMSDRLSYQIARDIYYWLQKPSMNALLGDAESGADANP